MNLLYQSIFPASLLPWSILALFYLMKMDVFNFLILAMHISTKAVVIFHIPGLNTGMIRWNRLLQIQRLSLWLIYAIRCHVNQPFISFIVFLFLGTNIKLLERFKEKTMSTTIHTFMVLTFCSSTTTIPCLMALACAAIYYFIERELKIQWEMHNTLKMYFNIRLVYDYMFFLVEWSVSDMNTRSLPVIVLVCIVLNGAIFLNLPEQYDDMKDEWYIPKTLPENYPYPLNIKEAVERCNMAKKLFKSHEL